MFPCHHVFSSKANYITWSQAKYRCVLILVRKFWQQQTCCSCYQLWMCADSFLFSSWPLTTALVRLKELVIVHSSLKENSATFIFKENPKNNGVVYIVYLLFMTYYVFCIYFVSFVYLLYRDLLTGRTSPAARCSGQSRAVH